MTMQEKLGFYRAPDGAEGGAPAPVADEGTRALEGLGVQVKALADNVEGYKQRMTEQFGKDLKGVQEETEAKVRALEAKLLDELRKTAAPAVTATATKEDLCGFSEGTRGFGEFVAAVSDATRDRGKPVDARLVKLQEGAARTLNMATGAAGGFLVAPQQWAGEIFKIAYPLTLLQTRCRQIPAGDAPDAEISIPALDQTGTKGLYSGVTVYPMSEGGTVTTNAGIAFKQITLKPLEFGAILPSITEKLLRNAPALGAFVTGLLRDSVTSYVENTIVSGGGVTTPLGWRTCAARYLVTRATTSEINYMDCVNMMTRILPSGGNYVWVAHPLCKAQLMSMTDGAGQLVWQMNGREGEPQSLLGLPVIYSEFMAALGSAGDFALVDLSYYLLRNGAPLKITDDMGLSGTNFSTNMRSIKGVFSIDGQPWLQSTLKLQDGTTEVSPFVVLNA
jgi:HK97 family phage major capsid protein